MQQHTPIRANVGRCIGRCKGPRGQRNAVPGPRLPVVEVCLDQIAVRASSSGGIIAAGVWFRQGQAADPHMLGMGQHQLKGHKAC